MVKLQLLGDKVAIGLSLLCTVHCLALPLLVFLLPALSGVALMDEAFHHWMLVVVIPTSLLALTMGCGKHKQYRVVTLIVLGLLLLCAPLYLGHESALLAIELHETGERLVTVMGACLIAVGHLWNHQLCRRLDYSCHS